MTRAMTLALGALSIATRASSRRRATPGRASRRVRPSRKGLGELVGSGPSWLTKLSSLRSRRTAAPIEAATLTPSSYSLSEAHDRASSSKTMSRWALRVSSNWRTMSLPVRAVVFQWTLRRSSPGM